MFDITIENMNTNMVGRKLKGEQGNGIQNNNLQIYTHCITHKIINQVNKFTTNSFQEHQILRESSEDILDQSPEIGSTCCFAGLKTIF